MGGIKHKKNLGGFDDCFTKHDREIVVNNGESMIMDT
jgi:hypothetical protein